MFSRAPSTLFEGRSESGTHRSVEDEEVRPDGLTLSDPVGCALFLCLPQAERCPGLQV